MCLEGAFLWPSLSLQLHGTQGNYLEEYSWSPDSDPQDLVSLLVKNLVGRTPGLYVKTWVGSAALHKSRYGGSGL